jgi:hypothetical protein
MYKKKILYDYEYEKMIEDNKFILISATGRSGSTTLQRIIHTIPDSNICGENSGAINNLLKFYESIKECNTRDEKISFFVEEDYNNNTKIDPINDETEKNESVEEHVINKQKPCWYNSFQYDKIIESIRKIILKMFKNSTHATILGFKEIRYNDGNINLINQFRELFPNTKIVIHIKRDIDNQSKRYAYHKWFENEDESIKFIEKYNNDLIEFYNNNRDFCYLSTFENMFDIHKIKEMFDFLGYQPNETIIQQILSNPME